MVTIPRPRIVRRSADLEAEDLPEQVTIAVRDLAGAVKKGLLALSVGVGLAVVHELFEAEVTRLAGPKGKHDPERQAYRHGQEPRQVTLGGRRVQVDKPRVRSVDNEEVELRTFHTFAGRELLSAAALERMLAGLSTRRYPAGLEPIGDVEPLATSKSAISRRFVQGTEQKLAELFGRDLSQLDLLAIFIDGVLIAEHCVVVALGVDAEGRKHPLGLWEGSTENKTVCNALLGNLIERGLDPEQPRLFVIDGGKAIRAAITATFGKHGIIQRCRAHKRRNVLDHLPQSERAFIGRKLDQAWKEPNAERAEAQLRALAKHLEVKHPGAAASLLEGLEETLTVTRLALSPTLLRTFKSTNPVESMISIGRTVAGNVKRWRDGKMVLRWTAAGLLEAEKQFRRVNGYREMAILRRALDQHYQGLASTRKIA
ncbi:MAG TPA: IS256 family transposase [Burkholderiales bacterium]